MKFWLLVLSIASFILVACGGSTTTNQEENPNQGDVSEMTTEPAESPATVVASPTEPATVIPATAILSDPTREETAPLEPTIVATIEPSPQPEEQTAAFNGPFENTYYRGAEDAPITMIDYSDFL